MGIRKPKLTRIWRYVKTVAHVHLLHVHSLKSPHKQQSEKQTSALVAACSTSLFRSGNWLMSSNLVRLGCLLRSTCSAIRNESRHRHPKGQPAACPRRLRARDEDALGRIIIRRRQMMSKTHGPDHHSTSFDGVGHSTPSTGTSPSSS
jgi:hypothetical protein